MMRFVGTLNCCMNFGNKLVKDQKPAEVQLWMSFSAVCSLLLFVVAILYYISKFYDFS